MKQFIIYAAAGILAGTAGAMGLGGGSILLLCLTLGANVGQLKAQGINLIFFLPCAVTALFLHHRDNRIEWSYVLPAAVYGIAGSLAGYWISGLLSVKWLGRIYGALLLALGVRELLHRKSSEAKGSGDRVNEKS